MLPYMHTCTRALLGPACADRRSHAKHHMPDATSPKQEGGPKPCGSPNQLPIGFMRDGILAG